MNKLKATVANQKSANGLTKIEAICANTTFGLILFEDEPTDRVAQEVWLLIKESEIAIAKTDIQDISISNRIQCEILEIKKGEILSEVVLGFSGRNLSSFITTDSLVRLSLEKNATVYALIKANEIYIESIDD